MSTDNVIKLRFARSEPVEQFVIAMPVLMAEALAKSGYSVARLVVVGGSEHP